MSGNGLMINELSFADLTTKEQNLVLFKNISRIEEKIDYLKNRDGIYVLNRKIQYWWLSGLTLLFFGYMGLKQKLGL